MKKALFLSILLSFCALSLSFCDEKVSKSIEFLIKEKEIQWKNEPLRMSKCGKNDTYPLECRRNTAIHQLSTMIKMREISKKLDKRKLDQKSHPQLPNLGEKK